jgi:hypothetical protein
MKLFIRLSPHVPSAKHLEVLVLRVSLDIADCYDSMKSYGYISVTLFSA